MKLSLVSLCVLLGIAFGWGADPAPKPPQAKPAPRASTGERPASVFPRIRPPLPAGSYVAVNRDGVRLSAVIVSPGDTSFSKMPTDGPNIPKSEGSLTPKLPPPAVDPGLRFERR